MDTLLHDELDAGVLAKLVEGSGVPFRNGKQSYIFDCPRCGKKQKLYIRKRDGKFVCWYCKEIDGFKGRAEYALREILGMSIGDLQFKLYGIGASSGGAQMELDLTDFWGDEEDAPDDEEDPQEPVVMPYHFYDLDHAFAAKGRAYMEGRGLPLAVCKEYGVRYSPIQRRVIFPVVMHGILYGWQARTILPSTDTYDEKTGQTFSIPKILTSTGLARDRMLMFWDRSKDQDHLVVTEGPVDAMKCHLLGGNNASMGKAVAERQARLLMEHPARDVYLALDPDAAEETARLVRDLGSEKRVYLLEPARGFKDLGEMPLEGVVEQYRVAQRVNAGHLFIFLG